MTVVISPARVQQVLREEEEKFVKEHPKSKALYAESSKYLLGGVPMNWMVRWGPFPVFVKSASGNTVEDVDGKKYLDLCLGDTGSMFGHSPAALVERAREQLGQGLTMMLPTQDCIAVGKKLQENFGLPLYWQIAISATDANRNLIRLARRITGRKYILVFNGCYHGTVDETLCNLRDGKIVPRFGNMGPPVHPAETTKIVEFNDIPALEAALKSRDVAAVLAEPAMTNRGIILPDEGFHKALRSLTRQYGSLLIIDETHTICCGVGGYTAAYGLEPDMVTLGKPIGGGIPGAAYGMTKEIADQLINPLRDDSTDENGLGGTLTANALSLAAMKVTLEKIITKENFEKMLPLAIKFEQDIQKIIREEKLPWHVTRLGTRIEYHFTPNEPRNGGEYERTRDSKLGYLMHLMALNRGILMTPFHNMALISPFTTLKEVEHHTAVFYECVKLLKAPATAPSKL